MNTEKLFSYGTLQHETVQLATFGRKLTGAADSLVGYYLDKLQIKDPDIVALSGEDFHSIIRFDGNNINKIKGVVFDITPKELIHADEYESTDYKRVKVQLDSGIYAWVYVGH